MRKAIKTEYCGEKKSCGLCKISVKSRLFPFFVVELERTDLYAKKEMCCRTWMFDGERWMFGRKSDSFNKQHATHKHTNIRMRCNTKSVRQKRIQITFSVESQSGRRTNAVAVDFE